ncbi:MAG TPA: hypothetical protein VK943_10210, partial [Arenibaculum sp.]|nr:hypothetical protein [Arenibaculum sp.]
LPAIGHVVPPGLLERRARRAGAHVSGSARLPADRGEAGDLGFVSPGLSVGADLRLDGTRSLGIAMGYAGSAGLEASTAALYALHEGQRGSLGLLAGAGNARFSGSGRAVSRAGLIFGAADLRARVQPLDGVTFEPSARLGFRHVGAAGREDAVYRMDAVLGLGVTYGIENDWGMIRPNLFLGVRRQFDAGPSRSRSALHRLSPTLEPDMGWRVGVSATPWIGPTFSLDHEAPDGLEGGGPSTVTARMRMRF